MSDVSFSSQTVYELEPILDDPRFEGFAQKIYPNSFRSGKSLAADFLPENWNSRDWVAPTLSDLWEPLEVIGRVRKFNDYPCLNMSIPAFSERAVAVLHDMLSPNGELLRLLSDLGNYWAFNVTTVADVLDWRRSDIKWNRKPIHASIIERYEFSAELLSELEIFQIPELPGNVYVTEVFRRRVEENGLQGFNFIRLWPLPPNVSWSRLAREQSKRQETQDLPSGQSIKGNSLVIRLMLPNGLQEPTNEHWARLSAILNNLDALLLDTDSATPYIGSVEGHDVVQAEFRVFCSCPDVDELSAQIQEWRERIDWDGPTQFVKRYGHFTDPDAKEVVIE
ncbi:MAG: hypothetical protein KDA37_13745 [Planctomycetales bacterium]|nr:hypothetical protein [Planctomycetales bacterium]